MKNAPEETEESIIRRTRVPKDKEMLGVVTGMMGGSRMKVECKDGKERLCRIPGRLKNRVWVRDRDVVIIIPWEIGGDKRGDIVWRYNPIQARWLKRKGYI